MQALDYWKTVTADRSEFLDRLLQTDARYAAFVEHAQPRAVLGLTLPVARVEDILPGKVRAALDASRRPSKRQRDLADISRLLEAYAELRPRVPPEILERLL